MARKSKLVPANKYFAQLGVFFTGTTTSQQIMSRSSSDMQMVLLVYTIVLARFPATRHKSHQRCTGWIGPYLRFRNTVVADSECVNAIFFLSTSSLGVLLKYVGSIKFSHWIHSYSDPVVEHGDTDWIVRTVVTVLWCQLVGSWQVASAWVICTQNLLADYAIL